MTILDSAEALLQAKNYSGSGAWLDEANSHDAQLGTTSGADTNDPLFKAHAGTQYIFLPGSANNSMSLPNLTAYNFTTADFDFRMRLAADDYTPGAVDVLANKWVTGATNGYRFEITTGGLLQYVTGNAGTDETLNSSTAIPFSNGDLGWIRFALVGTTLTYYTSTTATNDPTAVSWTQLGTTDTITQDPGTGTGSFFIGRLASSDANQFAGAVYRVFLDIGGTVELDVVLADATEPFATFTEQSSNAATVTINYASSGLIAAVIDRPQFILNTDDEFVIADSGLDFADGEDFTIILVSRLNIIAGVLADKSGGFNAAATGWRMDVHSPSLSYRTEIADGTNEPADLATGLADIPVRELMSAAARRDDAAPELEIFRSGTGTGSPSTTAAGDLTNALDLWLGNRNGGNNWINGSIMAFALWRSAITDAQIQEAHDLLVGDAIPATVSPAAITTVLALNTPTLSNTDGGPATVTPAAVALAAVLNTPTLIASSIVTPNQIATVVTINTPTLVAGSVVTPSQIATAVTINTPILVGGAVATPAEVAAVVTMNTPILVGGAVVTPAQVAAAVTMNTPTIAVPAIVTPAQIVAVATLNTPTPVGGAVATPAPVGVVVALLTPTTANTDAGSAVVFVGIYGVGQVLKT